MYIKSTISRFWSNNQRIVSHAGMSFETMMMFDKLKMLHKYNEVEPGDMWEFTIWIVPTKIKFKETLKNNGGSERKTTTWSSKSITYKCTSLSRKNMLSSVPKISRKTFNAWFMYGHPVLFRFVQLSLK